MKELSDCACVKLGCMRGIPKAFNTRARAKDIIRRNNTCGERDSVKSKG